MKVVAVGPHPFDRLIDQRHGFGELAAGGEPLRERAGFLNLKGSLFDSAIMKTSVISDDFRKRYPFASDKRPEVIAAFAAAEIMAALLTHARVPA